MFDNSSIQKSESGLLLNKWGYDLVEEYSALIAKAEFIRTNSILDAATGTGRAVSILSRMYSNVITGDFSFDLKPESKRRISDEHLGKVSFIKLNLENLPFRNSCVENIVCMNTLHELGHPVFCLREILRITSSNGTLLLADFNPEGFDVMDRVHSIRYNKPHPRGNISINEIRSFLHNSYSNVKEINTKLNNGFIVRGKRNER